jgi:ElaB/YqjD/DUF883 family membrane-anchored ribosome-binding protein
MIDVRKLRLENAKLKRKVMRLNRDNTRLIEDYNNLLEKAQESNKQVTEYRALAQTLITKLTEQLNITETYVLGTPKKFKENK